MNQICPILDEWQRHHTVSNSVLLEPVSESYLAKLRQLISRYEQAQGQLGTDYRDWEKVVDFACTKIGPTIGKNSWRVYRNALQKALAPGLEQNLAPSALIHGWLGKLHDVTGISKKERALDKDMPSAKAKRVKKEEMQILRYFGHAPRNDIEAFETGLAVRWLEFNVLTSCRPNEVAGCELIYPNDTQVRVRQPSLVAPNTIKSEGSHALTETRTIPLDTLSYPDLLFIEQFLQDMHHYIAVHTYDIAYETLRKRLSRLTEKVVGHSISLSVGRTQYAGNSKSMQISAEERARAMGHLDESRAMRSYGRKQFGYLKIDVSEAADDDSDLVFVEEQ